MTTKKTQHTAVVFRVWRAAPRTVMALFPHEPGTNNPATCSSYEHVGQHGSADPSGCVHRSRPATRAEADPLASELRRIGYRLRFLRRIPRNSYAVRRAAISGT